MNQESEENPVSVKIMVDGPLSSKVIFLLLNENRKDIHDSIISICRCGGSDHMPFCDGKHRKIGFKVNIKIWKILIRIEINFP